MSWYRHSSIQKSIQRGGKKKKVVWSNSSVWSCTGHGHGCIFKFLCSNEVGGVAVLEMLIRNPWIWFSYFPFGDELWVLQAMCYGCSSTLQFYIFRLCSYQSHQQKRNDISSDISCQSVGERCRYPHRYPAQTHSCSAQTPGCWQPWSWAYHTATSWHLSDLCSSPASKERRPESLSRELLCSFWKMMQLRISLAKLDSIGQ